MPSSLSAKEEEDLARLVIFFSFFCVFRAPGPARGFKMAIQTPNRSPGTGGEIWQKMQKDLKNCGPQKSRKEEEASPRDAQLLEDFGYKAVNNIICFFLAEHLFEK